MIKKIGQKYIVVSETTGQSFGTYRTLVAAKRRLRQMEFFKRQTSQRQRKRRRRR